MSISIRKYKKLVCSLIIFSLAIVFFFYFFFLNYTEPTEIGIARNIFTGEIWLQEGGGWYKTAPWVRVAKIDTRPMRVAITTAGHGFNAKLVQFAPKEWRTFVEVEGFRYWWWANRISINFGYKEEYRGMKDIMRGYAYGVKEYPFIIVLEKFTQ